MCERTHNSSFHLNMIKYTSILLLSRCPQYHARLIIERQTRRSAIVYIMYCVNGIRGVVSWTDKIKFSHIIFKITADRLKQIDCVFFFEITSSCVAQSPTAKLLHLPHKQEGERKLESKLGKLSSYLSRDWYISSPIAKSECLSIIQYTVYSTQYTVHKHTS